MNEWTAERHDMADGDWPAPGVIVLGFWSGASYQEEAWGVTRHKPSNHVSWNEKLRSGWELYEVGEWRICDRPDYWWHLPYIEGQYDR